MSDSAALQQLKLNRLEAIGKLGPPPSQRFNRKLAKWIAHFNAIMSTSLTETTATLSTLYSAKYLEEMAMRPRPAFGSLALDMSSGFDSIPPRKELP
jgi:hypothetical protein